MAVIWKLLGEVQIKDLVALSILFLQLSLLGFVLYRAQKRPDFDVARFLRDENNKESAGRAFAFICLAVMSWGFAMLIFLDRMTEYYFFIFGGLWAGTPVAMEMVKKWNGAMPFGVGATYMNGYGPPSMSPGYPPYMYPRGAYPYSPTQQYPYPPTPNDPGLQPNAPPKKPTPGNERFDDPDSDRGKPS